MGNLFSGLFNLQGDKVDMGILEMLFYGLVPMIGQLFMRIFKYGGSLDKPYLLFPLFFIPPFSFIPVIFAKLGWIKKTDVSNPLDIYILIPIIVRFLLIILLSKVVILNNNIIQIIVLLFALIIANLLHITTDNNCKDKLNIINNTAKATTDSMLQYASGILGTYLVLFIPYVGAFIKNMRFLPISPYISKSINAGIWSLGILMGYMLVNMFDGNFSNINDICGGKINMIRVIVSIIAFAVSLFYQFKNVL